jgi:hypothetical protein
MRSVALAHARGSRCRPKDFPAPVGYEQFPDCLLRGRVLVRARAVLDGRRVTRAELAVRMERTRLPIAYTRINRDGSGAFYVSPHCD